MEEDWYVFFGDVLKSREMDSREGERESERARESDGVRAYRVSIDARW